MHAVPPKRDVAVVWGLVISVATALTVGSMGMSWGFWTALAIMLNVLLLSNRRFDTGFMDTVFNVIVGFVVVYCEQWRLSRLLVGTLVLLSGYVMWRHNPGVWRVRFTAILVALWGLWCWAEDLLRSDAPRFVAALLSLLSGWSGCAACGVRDFRIAVTVISGPIWITWMILLVLLFGLWALYLVHRGDKAWLVVANMFALPLAWAYGIWRAIREAAIGKYDMDRSRWIGIALSVPAFGLVGPGAVPFALLAIVVLEVADDPGPPQAEKRSAKVIDCGVFTSVLRTKAFLQAQLQQCYVKLEAENIHAMLADLVRFEVGDGFGSGLVVSSWSAMTVHHVVGALLGVKGGSKKVGVWQNVSSKLRAILGIKSTAKRDFTLTSACLMEWYDPVHDGIVVLTSGDGTFRVAGRTNFGIFDVSMNDNGHYLLATWEIDAQGAITAYLHVIDSVERTENGLLAYVADVTPGSSGALLIHVAAGQLPTVIGANFAVMEGLPIGFALPLTAQCLEKIAECGYGVGKNSIADEEVAAGLTAGVSRAAAALPGAVFGALDSDQTAAQKVLGALGGCGLTVQEDTAAGEKKET